MENALRLDRRGYRLIVYFSSATFTNSFLLFLARYQYRMFTWENKGSWCWGLGAFVAYRSGYGGHERRG